MTTTADIDAATTGQTVPARFLETVSAHGDLVALRWKDDNDDWHELTYTEFADRVARVAAGLRRGGDRHTARLLRGDQHVGVADGMHLDVVDASVRRRFDGGDGRPFGRRVVRNRRVDVVLLDKTEHWVRF